MQQIKNQQLDLDDEIQKAKRSTGYLIMITRLNDNRLTHTYIKQHFRQNDIQLSIDEWKKLLRQEIINQNSIQEAEFLKDKEKKLPPRYRI